MDYKEIYQEWLANPYFDEDATIAAETQAYFSQLMKHRFPDIQYIIMNNEHNK